MRRSVLAFSPGAGSLVGDMRRVVIGVAAVGLLALGVLLAWANWPGPPWADGVRVDRLVVRKSERTLTAYAGGREVRVFRVSLGWNPVGPKEREGDRRTPEGIFTVTEHKRDSAYHRALRISYPRPEDEARARARGVSPGSDIMIHGVRNGLGWLGRAQRWFDWTAGCVALTNDEMDGLFERTVPGATVEILP